MSDQYRGGAVIVAVYSIRIAHIAITIAIALFEITCSRHLDDVDSKCARHRPHLYEKCELDYNFMALWCDHTNFTSLPHPDHPRIHTQTPAYRARSIHLNDSCIIHLEPEVLARYISLHIFNCDDNELTRIISKTFLNNSELEVLTLSHNWIAIIDDDALDGLHKLQKLSLQSNYLEQINQAIFKKLGELKTLNLSENRIHDMHDAAFEGTSEITELNLSANHLKSFRHQWISNMNKLQTLNLSGNQLSNPHSLMFLFNPMISKVDFSRNNMTCIPRYIFKNKTNLDFVNVSGNHLQTPRPEWFRSVYTKKNPKLLGKSLVNDNEWICDCQAYYYWYFLLSEVQEDEWREVFDVKCSSPPEHEGKMLSRFINDDFSSCKVGDVRDCEEEDFVPSLFINMMAFDKKTRSSSVSPSTSDSAHDENDGTESSVLIFDTTESDSSKFIYIALSGIFVALLFAFVLFLKRRSSLKQQATKRVENTQYANASMSHDVMDDENLKRRVLDADISDSWASKTTSLLSNHYTRNNLSHDETKFIQNNGKKAHSHRKEQFKQKEVTQHSNDASDDVRFLDGYISFQPLK